MIKKWTVNETQWLLDNYTLYGPKGSSSFLNMSIKRIKHKIGNLKKQGIILKFNPIINEEKKCSSCFNIKPLTSFYDSSKGRCGKHASCIDCMTKKDTLRYQEDIEYRLQKVLRKRYKTIVNKEFTEHKAEIIGCSLNEFKHHIELQFTKDMTWENYGKFWQIDHIIPINLLRQNLGDIGLIFNYRNCQPLEIMENIVKSDNIQLAKSYLEKKMKKFPNDMIYQEMMKILNHSFF